MVMSYPRRRFGDETQRFGRTQRRRRFTREAARPCLQLLHHSRLVVLELDFLRFRYSRLVRHLLHIHTNALRLNWN